MIKFYEIGGGDIGEPGFRPDAQLTKAPDPETTVSVSFGFLHDMGGYVVEYGDPVTMSFGEFFSRHCASNPFVAGIGR